MWQSLLGTALRSCYKMLGRINHSDLEEALSFAKDYKSCVQVLSPVADVLEFMHRSVCLFWWLFSFPPCLMIL